MSIAKVNDAQIPEDYTRNPEITKVNDTQIHQCTNIDKAYQWKSRKIGETQNSRNHQWKYRNHKKGEAYHKTGA